MCQDRVLASAGADEGWARAGRGCVSLEPDALDAGFAGRRSGGEKRLSCTQG